MSKLRASTFCCAFSSALLIQGWTMASPSLRPSFCSMRVHALGAEDAHQVVFEREIEQRAAGVALAAGAAAQLVVDAAALVALGADDEKTAGGQNLLPVGLDLVLDARRCADWRSAPSGRSASSVAMRISRLPPSLMSVPRPAMLVAIVTAPGNAGLRDDRRFLLVIAGVEHVVRNALGLQHGGEHFRFLDRGGAHEHGLAALAGLVDDVDDGGIFLAGGTIDLVILVLACHRHVGGDLDHVEPVDVHELFGFGGGGAGHAGELVVEAEVVLEGDGGQRHVLGLDGHVLLGLEGLVQALRIAPSRHHAAGELVDDDDLVVLDDVVLVALEQLVGAQRLLHVMHDGHVLGIVEVFALQQAGRTEHLFKMLVALLGQRAGALLLVELVVFRRELRNEAR